MMKKYLYIIISALVLIGCQKNTDPDLLFGKLPEERMAERNAELKNKLVGAENGWIASLNTSLLGGFGFYMKFNPDETVEMMGDVTEVSATESVTSTYRIKFVMNTSLIFDTYNYLTLLQDPSGGVPAQGLQSDFEFEYIRSTADSIILRGKRYQNTLSLVKATAAQAADYKSGKLFDKIEDISLYLNSHSNNYINIAGLNNKIATSIYSDKFIVFQYLNNEDSVVTVTGKYNFDLGGINFPDGVIVNGIKLSYGVLKDNVLKLYDVTGTEYTVGQNPTPILPLKMLFGGAIKTITVPRATTFAGWGADFIARRAQAATNVTRWNVGGSPLALGTISFIDINQNNKRFTLRFNTPYGSSSLNLDYPFTYVENEDGTYKFTIGTASGNAAAIQADLNPLLAQRINVDRFTMDYFIFEGQAYIQFKSVENPTFTFTGTF